MTGRDEPDVDAALDRAARFFGGSVRGPLRHGWKRKSAGTRLEMPDGRAWWMRVQYADPQQVSKHLWSGEVDASAIDGVNKPTVHKHVDWLADGMMWRATLMTLMESGAASTTADLRHPIPLTADWFDGLLRSLQKLATQPTERIACGQAHLDKKIRKIFGDGIDTRVKRWMVSHGDLHWANIGWPEPVLFDWERWGRAPMGLDAAALLVHSGRDPAIAGAVERAFHDVLASRDGLIAKLYACADTIFMIRRFNHPSVELLPSVEALAGRTLAELSGTVRS